MPTAGNGHGHGVDRYAPWLLLAPVPVTSATSRPTPGADPYEY